MVYTDQTKSLYDVSLMLFPLTLRPVVPEKQESEVAHTMAPGDVVVVAEGELQHLQGKVIRVDGNKITIMPKHEDLKVCILRVLARKLELRPLVLACAWIPYNLLQRSVSYAWLTKQGVGSPP